jgi:hypothetical protein
MCDFLILFLVANVIVIALFFASSCAHKHQFPMCVFHLKGKEEENKHHSSIKKLRDEKFKILL